MPTNSYEAGVITQQRASLESVLRTDEFLKRESRPPDYESENRALAVLINALNSNPRCILQRLTDMALKLCRADSAGVSLLETDEGVSRFRWPAISGKWSNNVGGGMPADASPCGHVLATDAVQVFAYPERHYQYSAPLDHPICEALLTPFHYENRVVGTVWVVAHDEALRFDCEDMRLIVNLGSFAAKAYKVLRSLEWLTRENERLRNVADFSPPLISPAHPAVA